MAVAGRQRVNARIAMFDDPSFVDSAGSTCAESDNVQMNHGCQKTSHRGITVPQMGVVGRIVSSKIFSTNDGNRRRPELIVDPSMPPLQTAGGDR
jgi:hypothetical protein